MKNILAALITLSLILLPFAASAKSKDSFKAPDGWKEGFTQNNEFYHLTEYVPAGQSVKKFHKIISVTEFQKKIPVSLKTFADKQVEIFKGKGCATQINADFLPELMRKELGDTRIAVVYQCKKLNTSGMNFLLQEKDGLFTVYTYEYKAFPLNEMEQQQIANTFAGIDD